MLAALAISIVSCADPKENPQMKALISSYLESDTAQYDHLTKCRVKMTKDVGLTEFMVSDRVYRRL